MEGFVDTAKLILGLDGNALSWWQLVLRVILIYAAGLGLVRIGKRRFMGTYTAFDMILGITVGALLANAAADSEVFLNAIFIVFGLVMLHWVLAFVTYNWDPVEVFLLGTEETIIEDGDLQPEGMRRTRISRSDIEQALRSAGLEEIGEVKRAYLERNGNLSIIPFNEEEQEEGRDYERRSSAEEDGSPGQGERSAGDGFGERSNGHAQQQQQQQYGAKWDGQVVEIDVQEGVQRVVVELR